MRLELKALRKPFAYSAVILIASLTRLINLGYPNKLVFDETYYVKDALTLSLEGHEKSWPENANAAFEAGSVFGYLQDPAFVVHPPFGKWLIASGMSVFGQDSSFGWRISTAVLGILTVALVLLVAYKLFRSSLIAVAAGLALAVDGLAITMSRTALLDASLTFFLLLGFYLFLFDQQVSRWRILQDFELAKPGVIWFRPWLIATGVILGLAASIKWSGFYLIAFIGLYVVSSELLMRRASGQPYWLSRGLLTQGFASFVNLVPAAIATYMVTWIGWISGTTGYARNFAAENPAIGIAGIFPDWLRSLWHYHELIYRFHLNLTAEHAYEAHPIGWLISLRPTAFFFESYEFGQNGCEIVQGCSSAITALANPALSMLGVIALGYFVYRYFKNRERNIGLVLLAVGAMYLPWLVFSERTVFQFYTVSLQPWLMIAIGFVVQRLYSHLAIRNSVIANALLLGLAGLVLALSWFFLPVNTGIFLPFEQWQWRMWLPSWI